MSSKSMGKGCKRTINQAALQVYLQLKDEVFNDEAKTLAYWRMKNAEVEKALADYCLGDEPQSMKEAYKQTMSLFKILNPVLAHQEQEDEHFAIFKRSFVVDQNQIPIVIGGKPVSEPKSISEMLVQMLGNECSPVYTISRSKVTYEGIAHLDYQGLDKKDGENEFLDIFSRVVDNCHPAKGENQQYAIYFTLGDYKGSNAFQRNLQSAHNLATAIQKSKDFKLAQLVVTGTDATLPSDHMDNIVHWKDGIMLTIPSYRISNYNFVYAMSKLGQFLILAEAVVKNTKGLLPKTEYMEFFQQKISRIWKNVIEAGGDATYKIEKESDEDYISMKELDMISKRLTEDILPMLKKYFRIASDISICFTPLHGKPWSEASLSHKSPKGYILEQVVRRLKNAISIQQAARNHFTY
eukprot:CAMPEP_0194207108 /NCGR_PEP_ID=MMETSP0156-20130528/5959_1 /TAXON_ID=33649 /ORGANISM="Thalassionema nitzschioides, Strain L26-B" /LENGTH=409 /DNA_ID=CAMNT_0038933803 /DNA_START=71 /DNA_END=1300 /DNA_ORIENTATION=+